VLRKKEGCVVDVATLVDAIRLFFFFRRWEGVRWWWFGAEWKFVSRVVRRVERGPWDWFARWVVCVATFEPGIVELLWIVDSSEALSGGGLVVGGRCNCKGQER